MDASTPETTVATLVATHCAVCNRTLKDAQSVERGIGPDCFRKYYDKCSGQADFRSALREAQESGLLDRIASLLDRQDARGACNVVLHAIACEWEHPANVSRVMLVRALGFDKLALKLEERLYGDRGLVQVRAANDGTLVVTAADLDRAQFNAFVAAIRAIPSRRWDSDARANVVAAAHRRLLWRALRDTLAGVRLVTESGESYIPARPQRAA